MKQEKIQKKFFLILFGLILMIFAVQNGLQWLFLEPYYEHQTHQSMVSEVSKLSNQITSAQSPEATMASLNDFYLRTGRVAAVFNRSGWTEYGTFSSFETPLIQIQSADGKDYTLNIQEFYNQQAFQDALVAQSHIAVEGYFSPANPSMLSPQKIILANKTFESTSTQLVAIQVDAAQSLAGAKTYKVEAEPLSRSAIVTTKLSPSEALISTHIAPLSVKRLEGIVKDYRLPSKENLVQNYEYNQLLTEGYRFVYQQLTKANASNTQLYSYETTDVNTGLAHQFMFMPVNLNGDLKYLGISYRKESLEKSVSIAQSFNSWLILLSFFMVFFVARFLSRMITRPLVAMEHVTRKMVDLDFSERLTIHENNEIGSLANHINVLSAELEKRIQDLERRKDILEENLAYKDQLNEQRKMFMASVSHDFKTPLTIIQGICEGAQNEIYNLKDPKELSRIQFQLNILNTMVDNLLTIAKFDRGVYAKEPSHWLLSDLVYEVYAELKEMASHKHIQVIFDLEDYFVFEDEEKIRIVIRNLMANALQHTPEGESVRIIMQTDGDCHHLIFENPGSILPGDMAKIFDAFYRPDASRNQNSGGSGLGLYLVKQILDLCELPFYIESPAGKVRIWIDFKRLDEDFSTLQK